jgi:hypothetical protein
VTRTAHFATIKVLALRRLNGTGTFDGEPDFHPA